MKFQFDADAFADYGKHLSAEAQRITARAALVVQKSAFDLQRGAMSRCPVDTGNLRGSISTEFRGGAGSIEAEIGPTAHYGGYVEDGTSKMAPQPYMGPATDEVEPKFLAAVAALTEGL